MTIVATGLCVGGAVEAAEKLAADGINAEVINIHTIQPLDEEIILNSAKKTGKVVVADLSVEAGSYNRYSFDVIETNISEMDMSIPEGLTEVEPDDYF